MFLLGAENNDNLSYVLKRFLPSKVNSQTFIKVFRIKEIIFRAHNIILYFKQEIIVTYNVLQCYSKLYQLCGSMINI